MWKKEIILISTKKEVILSNSNIILVKMKLLERLSKKIVKTCKKCSNKPETCSESDHFIFLIILSFNYF